MNKRTAIITGIRGQDGSYLAELLLEKGYEVIGIKRRESQGDLGCSKHLEGLIKIEEADLSDLTSLMKVTGSARADEFYNLAAQSHVGTSFSQPSYTLQTNAIGVYNCLEAIRESGIHTRFYQASTSELFGGVYEFPCNEDTPFCPQSPYGVAKLAAYYAVRNYRDGYKMFACNGILFNHESPRRGPQFVTRKITRAVAAIDLGLADHLELGNLDARRDWGHAKDYVEGMWRMLQHNHPDDYVLATGEAHSVREFCDAAFSYREKDYKDYVRVNPAFYRPTEVNVLIGSSVKAQEVLGWKPRFTFQDLVQDMVNNDTRELKND